MTTKPWPGCAMNKLNNTVKLKYTRGTARQANPASNSQARALRLRTHYIWISCAATAAACRGFDSSK